MLTLMKICQRVQIYTRSTFICKYIYHVFGKGDRVPRIGRNVLKSSLCGMLDIPIPLLYKVDSPTIGTC